LKPWRFARKVATGASNVKADRRVPTDPSTVTVTSNDAPNPVGTVHLSAVRENQDVDAHTVAPTRTVEDVS